MVRVAFIHPDLGIGGAERLIVDSALTLQDELNYGVTIHTAHHDPSHCFPETKDNNILTVIVNGDWLPRRLFFLNCAALCAYIRMVYVSLCFLLFFSSDVNVVICDQIAACLPLLATTRFFCEKMVSISTFSHHLPRLHYRLKCISELKFVFYCHFPDKLLVKKDESKGQSFYKQLKNVYRSNFLDVIEEYSTGLADLCLVNSQFTADIFHKSFPSLRRVMRPHVLYPPVSSNSIDCILRKLESENSTDRYSNNQNSPFTFISVNRFEGKKDLPLAVKSFAKLLSRNIDGKTMNLILCGGFDPLNNENASVYQNLKVLCADLKLNVKEVTCISKEIDFSSGGEVTGHVYLVKSPSEEEKIRLLALPHASSCLLYTPFEEHFGIVPLEAMYCKTAVVALRSGGPIETIVDGETGLLVDCYDQEVRQCEWDDGEFDGDSAPENASKAKLCDDILVNNFEKAMFRMVKFGGSGKLAEMGTAGRKRVINEFSNFHKDFERLILGVMSGGEQLS